MFSKPIVHIAAPEGALHELVEALAQALKGRGIPFIDLLPHFRAWGAAGVRLFLLFYFHPNARGYALVADAVRQRLEEDASRMAKMESARESRIRRN